MIYSKTLRRLIIVTAALGLVLASFAGQTAAASGQKKITAVFKETRLSLNGRPVSLKDSKGNELKLFSYNNMEYIPIQTAAGSLRLSASYSSKTNTVTIKSSTSSAIRMEDRTGGAIRMRPGNATGGGIRMKPGNGAPEGMGTPPGNATPGAIGMRPGNGMAGEGKNATTAAVKITEVKKSLTVTYKNIKVIVNGKTATLKDAKGSTLEPFIYGSDEYVPVKALAQALGLSYSYDKQTNTILLSGKK